MAFSCYRTRDASRAVRPILAYFCSQSTDLCQGIISYPWTQYCNSTEKFFIRFIISADNYCDDLVRDMMYDLCVLPVRRNRTKWWLIDLLQIHLSHHRRHRRYSAIQDSFRFQFTVEKRATLPRSLRARNEFSRKIWIPFWFLASPLPTFFLRSGRYSDRWNAKKHRLIMHTSTKEDIAGRFQDLFVSPCILYLATWNDYFMRHCY